MPEEKTENHVSKKGSGLSGLILFSLIAFAIGSAGIYLLTHFWKKKDLVIDKERIILGYLEGNAYVNPWLGWEINFPPQMSVLGHKEISDWQRLPQIPGFENQMAEQTKLFLALGEAFSVISLARLDRMEQLPYWQSHDRILANAQEKFRQSIINNTHFECFVKVSDTTIDHLPFKLMEVIFVHNEEEQKRQVIYSTIINNYMLHITVVYYSPAGGSLMINAINESVFLK